MADILNTISIISFIAAGLFAVLSIVFFVVFKIWNVIGDLSGRNAKKSLERMRQNNEKTGNKVYEADAKKDKPDKAAGRTGKSETGRGKTEKSETNRGKAGNGETGMLHENKAGRLESQETARLDDGTVSLNGLEETAPLQNEAAKVERQPASVSVELIERIMIIHTEEVI